MKYLLRILFTPDCWIRNAPTSKELSAFINKSLDDGHIPKRFDDYIIKLNGKTLWVCNFPYAFGDEIDCEGFNKKPNVLPDRKTVFRLYDAVLVSDQIDRLHK